MLDLAKKASPLGIHIVSGSTGLLDKDYQVLKNLADKILQESYLHQILQLEQVLMMELASIAGKYFEYADLVESHHENKIDAPSGTAMSIAEAAASKRQNDFKQNEVEKETIKILEEDL